MAQFKISEWQSGSGRWYAADTATFTKWWAIPRFLNIGFDKYIEMLKNEYKVDEIVYNSEANVLLFSWKNNTMCHKFVLFVNRMARKGCWNVDK